MKIKRFIAIVTITTFCFTSCFYDLFLGGYVYAQGTNVGIDNLNLGIRNYETAKYEYAIVNFNMALTQIPEYDKENLWETHFYLGISYYLIGDVEEAKKEFKKAKEILGNKTLDPEIFSPKIVKFFNQIKVEKEPEIEIVASEPSPPQSACHENEKGQKPFFCKWWFWGLLAVVGGGLAGATGGGGGGGDNGGGGGDNGGGDDTVTISW